MFNETILMASAACVVCNALPPVAVAARTQSLALVAVPPLVAGVAAAFAWAQLPSIDALSFLGSYPRVSRVVVDGILALPYDLRAPWGAFRITGTASVATIANWVIALAILRVVLKRRFRTLRGTQIRNIALLDKVPQTLRSWTKPALVLLGGVPVPIADECLHFCITGAPGTGKTTQIKLILDVVIARGQKAVVVDCNGEMLSRFFRAGDKILSLVDARSVAWSPFAEIAERGDFLEVAKKIIPPASGDSKEWYHYAATLVAVVLERLYELGGKHATNGQLYDFLAIKPTTELAELVRGTEAERFFAPGAERMLSSTLGIVASHIGYFRFLPPDAGPDVFGIQNWVESGAKGVLWLTYRSKREEASRPLLRAWADLTISAACALDETQTGRIWIVIDELRSVGKLPQLPTLAARGRKHGAVMVLGYQAVAHLREIYGHDAAEGVLACAAHRLILRCPDKDTAKYQSAQIGEAETERVQRGTSRPDESIAPRSAGSLNENIVREIGHVVLPSTLSELPKFEGYAFVLGNGWTRVRLVRGPDRPIVVAPYVARETLTPGVHTPAPTESVAQPNTLRLRRETTSHTPDARSAAADPDPNSGEKPPSPNA